MNEEIYIFKPYKENFPIEYKHQEQKLRKIIGNSPIIEHIGSTAVPKLGGKGIIDILIGVPQSEINNTINQLVKNKFTYKHAIDNNQRFFLKKKYQFKGKPRTLHIQLTQENSEIHRSAIKTRNHLTKNKKAREEYTKIKKQAVKIAQGEGKKYRDHKSEFLKRISQI